jgi:RNA polymerase sigma factor (sigma-70 family)
MQTDDWEMETIDIKAHHNGLDPHRWVNNYADHLYTFAVFRVNDEELAQDLVQETFLAALQRVEKFEGRCTEKTWLTAILKNKIIDVYRSKSSGLVKGAAAPAPEDPDTRL